MMNSSIPENLRQVQRNIESACRRTGRDANQVTLIAVSKKKPLSDVLEAHGAGAVHFGENYVQEWKEKNEQLRGMDAALVSSVQWHMIGHLQKNKVKYLIGQVALIHSVDTLELAWTIEREAGKKDLYVPILLEVNVAGEESKWGFHPEEVRLAAEKISSLPHVRLLGLMTSAPFTTEPESNRVYFRELRKCGEELEQHDLLRNSASFRTPILSMGMTGDYEIAVEEGATMVRVGTGIFGERAN